MLQGLPVLDGLLLRMVALDHLLRLHLLLGDTLLLSGQLLLGRRGLVVPPDLLSSPVYEDVDGGQKRHLRPPSRKSSRPGPQAVTRAREKER